MDTGIIGLFLFYIFYGKNVLFHFSLAQTCVEFCPKLRVEALPPTEAISTTSRTRLSHHIHRDKGEKVCKTSVA